MTICLRLVLSPPAHYMVGVALLNTNHRQQLLYAKKLTIPFSLVPIHSLQRPPLLQPHKGKHNG